MAAAHLTQVEQWARTRLSLSSGGLMNQLVESVREGDVFSDPADHLAGTREFLNGVTAADCTAAFRELWTGGTRFVGAMGSGFKASRASAVREVYEKSARQAVTAPTESAVREFAYSDFGSAGKIERRDFDDALGFHRVTFANGVRLNVKRTNFLRDGVEIRIAFPGGLLAQAVDGPALSRFMGVWALGGLLKHTAAELADLGTTHVSSLSFFRASEQFGMSLSTRPSDLRYSLELATAHFLEPAFSKDAWRKVWSEQLPARKSALSSLDGIASLRIHKALAADDGRLEIPGLLRTLFLSRSTFVDWFEPIVKTSPLEIAIVGDVDPEEIIREVARTLGTLPERRRERSVVDGPPLRAGATPVRQTFTYRSSEQKALVTLAWRADGGSGFAERQKLVILARILQDRVFKKIRTEMGSTYAPSVELEVHDFSPDYAQLICRVETTPERTKDVENAVEELALSLAEHGVTEEEFDRARAPMLAEQASEVRTNGYWLDLLSSAQSNPARVEWWKVRTVRLKSLTKADLDEAAREYFRADRVAEFIVLPKG